MKLKLIEAVIFAAAGCSLIAAGSIMRHRVVKMRLLAFVYAGALFLLGALAMVVDWSRLGVSAHRFNFYATIGGACFFLYLSFVQHRQRPRSIVWILYLIGGIGLGLTAIFWI